MRRRAYLAAVAGGAAVGTAGCLGGPPGGLAPSSDDAVPAGGTWDQPGGGPGNAYAMAGPGPVDGVESRWRYGGRDDEHLRPHAVVDGTVFAASSEGVVALDAGRGEQQWRASVDAGTDWLAVGHGNVYLPDGWIHMDPDEPSPRSYPAATEPGPDAGPMATAVSRLALTDDRLYYVADDRVVAAEPGASDPLWTVALGDPGSLALAGGTLCVVVDEGVVGLATGDGRERWRLDFESSYARVAGRDGRLYVAPSSGGPLRAVDAGTGEEAWRYDHGYPAYVAATDDHVVLGGTPRQGAKHRVEVLDPGGTRQWATPEERNDSTYDPPVVTDEAVFAAHVAGVFAYDLVDGERTWSLSTGRLEGLFGGGYYPIGDVIPTGSGLVLQQDGDVYGLGPA